MPRPSLARSEHEAVEMKFDVTKLEVSCACCGPVSFVRYKAVVETVVEREVVPPCTDRRNIEHEGWVEGICTFVQEAA